MPRTTLAYLKHKHCTFGSVYEVVKNHLTEDISENAFNAILGRLDSVRFTSDAVHWRIDDDPILKHSRGLNASAFEVALDTLHYKGYIPAGHYRYPSSLEKRTSRSYHVKEVTKKKKSGTTRERWSPKAKHFIQTGVLASTPVDDLISKLVDKGLRGDTLNWRILRRQMERMVPDWFSEEVLIAYKKAHQKRVATAYSSPLGSPWTEEEDVALLEDALGLTPAATGRGSFAKLSKKFNKRKLRRTTGQAVRNRLRVLAKGLKGEVLKKFNELNHTTERSLQRQLPLQLGPAPVAVARPVAPVEPEKPSDLVVGTDSITFTLSKKTKDAAIKEYLTEERLKEAYREYVVRHLMQ